MIHEVLPAGEVNAVPANILASQLNLKSTRQLGRIVERERRKGFAICATTNSKHPGYYLAADPCELEDYIYSLDRRIKKLRATREACENTLHRMIDL